MDMPQRRILQFLIVVNSISIGLVLLIAIIELQSKLNKVHWRCNSVKGEVFCLGFILFLQIVGAITLSALTPSFQCSKHSACAGNAFLTVASWVLPVLLFIHLLEFVIRARRIAAIYPLVWSTVVWLVEWDSPDHYRNAQDMQQVAANTYFNDLDAVERGALKAAEASSESQGREPRKLLLPVLSRIPPVPHPSEVQNPPRYSKVFVPKDLSRGQSKQHRDRRPTTQARRHIRVTSLVSSDEGFIVYVPDNIQYVVPTIQPAPKPRKYGRAPPVPAKSWYHQRR